jgi:acetoacetate decarboxylase
MSLLTRGPLNRFEAITPSDTVDLPRYTQTKQLTDGVYVGAGAGVVVAVMADNTTCIFKGAITGRILPIGVRRINATTTTATDLVAVYQI